jgi:hypothetical protein
MQVASLPSQQPLPTPRALVREIFPVTAEFFGTAGLVASNERAAHTTANGLALVV